MGWFDTTGMAAWNSYDAYQPLLADDYSYTIPTPNRAELINRPAIVFDPRQGSCMNTRVSTVAVSSAEAVEFLFVVWSHPLAGGSQASTILDNGDAVRGTQNLPFVMNDAVLGGMRQGYARFAGGLMLWQDETGFPMWWSQISNGRPVLVRARYGQQPLLEAWGPNGLHMGHNSALPQDREAFATNYVLGRAYGSVSTATNAGMHLMEVNYYDHPISDDDLAAAVNALDSCYAVSA